MKKNKKKINYSNKKIRPKRLKNPKNKQKQKKNSKYRQIEEGSFGSPFISAQLGQENMPLLSNVTLAQDCQDIKKKSKIKIADLKNINLKKTKSIWGEDKSRNQRIRKYVEWKSSKKTKGNVPKSPGVNYSSKRPKGVKTATKKKSSKGNLQKDRNFGSAYKYSKERNQLNANIEKSGFQISKVKQKKRNKTFRYNSEGNPNLQSELCHKKNFQAIQRKINEMKKESEKRGAGDLMNALRILSRASDLSTQQVPLIEAKANEEDTFVTFDSQKQSYSMVSISSARKLNRFNQNLNSVSSIWLRNLTSSKVSSGMDNVSSCKTNSKISFEAQKKPRREDDVYFFSEVNNTPILEESIDNFEIKSYLTEENSDFTETKEDSRGEDTSQGGIELGLEDLPFPRNSQGNLDILGMSSLNSTSLENAFSILKKIEKKNLKFGFSELLNFEKKKASSLTIDPSDERDPRTKLMIKNIPNKYNILQLANLYSREFQDQFDFLYLVMDSKTNCNQGYGFINMVPGPAKYAFFQALNDTSWPESRSGKKCKITYAKLQNKDTINQFFLDKYFQECHKYWVPRQVILKRFPELDLQLDLLEKRREFILTSRTGSGQVQTPFVGRDSFQKGRFEALNKCFPFFGANSNRFGDPRVDFGANF